MEEILKFSVTPTLEIRRGAIHPKYVDELNDRVGKFIGRRGFVPEGQVEEVWSISLKHLMDLGQLPNPARMLEFLATTELPARCREILGSDIAISVEGTYIRDFDPKRKSVPAHYHFDAYVLGASVPMLNVWIPLNDVGTTSPGLTMAKVPFWPRSMWNRLVDSTDEHGLIRTGTRRSLMMQAAEVEALAGEEEEWPLFSPVMEVGDVMIFDHQHLHGTQHDLAKSGGRRSIEVRICSIEKARWLLSLGRKQTFVTLRS